MARSIEFFLVATSIFLAHLPEAKLQPPPLPPPPPPLIPNQFGQYDESNYLLVSDNEITQDASILKHLVSVSKEEVEEIVDSNPALQQALLDKVRKVVKLKQKFKAKKDEAKLAYQQAAMVNSYPNDIIVEGELDKPDSQGKLDALKMKLASGAIKIYKISNTLKRKVDRLMRKKNKLANKRPKRIRVAKVKESKPHFYFRVTKDSS